MKVQVDERIEKTRVIQKASEEAQKKLQSMEESFTKLTQVTGMYIVDVCVYVVCSGSIQSLIYLSVCILYILKYINMTYIYCQVWEQ